MKNKKELIKLIKESFNKKIGNTIFDKIINVLKPIILIFTLWITLEKCMGISEWVNGHSYFWWLLVSLIPCIYIFDTIYSILNLKKEKVNITNGTAINTANFIYFTIMTFLEIILFRIKGFWVDSFYIQILLFMILTFIFIQLIVIILVHLGNINEKINRFISLFILPLFCFSGIIYSLKTVHNHYIRLVLRINPITYLINGFRNGFIIKKYFVGITKVDLYFIIICLFLLFLGYILGKINKSK
jgi:teichoic acid transport system permease protein